MCVALLFAALAIGQAKPTIGQVVVKMTDDRFEKEIMLRSSVFLDDGLRFSLILELDRETGKLSGAYFGAMSRNAKRDKLSDNPESGILCDGKTFELAHKPLDTFTDKDGAGAATFATFLDPDKAIPSIAYAKKIECRLGSREFVLPKEVAIATKAIMAASQDRTKFKFLTTVLSEADDETLPVEKLLRKIGS